MILTTSKLTVDCTKKAYHELHIPVYFEVLQTEVFLHLPRGFLKE